MVILTLEFFREIKHYSFPQTRLSTTRATSINLVLTEKPVVGVCTTPDFDAPLDLFPWHKLLHTASTLELDHRLIN